MKITKQNYESIFLDYHEGNLSADDTAELFSFLEIHPELKEEFEQFEMVFLPEEISTATFPDKNNLRKDAFPTKENINEWLIAETENDLTLQERTLISVFLKSHPEFIRDRELFSKTKLIVDRTEIYPDKSSLKKRVIVPFVINKIWYAAAAFILLMGAWFILQKQKNDSGIAPVQRASKEITPENNQPKNNSPAVNTIPDSVNKKINNSSLKEKNTIAEISSPEKNKFIHHNKSVQNNFASNEKTLENKLASPQNNRSPDEIIIADRPIAMVINKNSEMQPVSTDNKTFTVINSPTENNNNSPLTFLDEVKDKTASSINTIAGEKVFATSENNSVFPLKSRLIKLAAQIVNKLSNNHVKVKTTFDPFSGNLAAYEVEMGKNKWQKQF